MAKIKKAQSGLSMLAKYAGKSTAKNLERSLQKSQIAKGIAKEAFEKKPFSVRLEAARKLEAPRPLSEMLGGAKRDFRSTTTPATQKSVSTGSSKAASTKSSIRKNYEGLKKGGVVKKSSKKK
jgi:hypothetical protein